MGCSTRPQTCPECWDRITPAEPPGSFGSRETEARCGELREYSESIPQTHKSPVLHPNRSQQHRTEQTPPASPAPRVHPSILRALRATLGPSHPRDARKKTQKNPISGTADPGPRPSSSRGAQQERGWHGGLLLNKKKQGGRGKGDEILQAGEQDTASPLGWPCHRPEAFGRRAGESGALHSFFQLPLRPLFVHQRPARAAARPGRGIKTPGRGFPVCGHSQPWHRPPSPTSRWHRGHPPSDGDTASPSPGDRSRPDPPGLWGPSSSGGSQSPGEDGERGTHPAPAAEAVPRGSHSHGDASHSPASQLDVIQGNRAGGDPAPLQAARAPSCCSQGAQPAKPTRGAPQGHFGVGTGSSATPKDATESCGSTAWSIPAPPPALNSQGGKPLPAPIDAPSIPLFLFSPLLELLQDPRVLQMPREPSLSAQSALAVGCGCDTEPGTVQGSLQLLGGSPEPGSTPRTPQTRAQSQAPPQTANSPSFPLGRAGESSFGRGLILNGKHPQKIIRGTQPRVPQAA